MSEDKRDKFILNAMQMAPVMFTKRDFIELEMIFWNAAIDEAVKVVKEKGNCPMDCLTFHVESLEALKKPEKGE